MVYLQFYISGKPLNDEIMEAKCDIYTVILPLLIFPSGMLEN